MKYKIIADSASDLTPEYIRRDDIGFEVVPLTINVGDAEFADVESLDVDAMMEAVDSYEGRVTTSCPSPEAYVEAVGDAENSFIVTITAGLSGSYNSACLAKNTVLESRPDANVCVIDSKETSGTQILIVDELIRLIDKGLGFEEICAKIMDFTQSKSLLFVLKKFDSLIKNGRMSKFAAKIATTLNIQPICIAKEGIINIAEKIIGAKKTVKRLVDMVGEKVTDFSKCVLIISHCQAPEEAESLKEKLVDRYGKFKEIRIIKMRGLTSYYAQKKGLIVCF